MALQGTPGGIKSIGLELKNDSLILNITCIDKFSRDHCSPNYLVSCSPTGPSVQVHLHVFNVFMILLFWVMNIVAAKAVKMEEAEASISDRDCINRQQSICIMFNKY